MPQWAKETIDLSIASSALTIDNIKIDGTTIGHTSDTDLLSFASGALTVNGTIAITGSISSALTLGSTLTVGADTDGHDVKFFGNTTGSYMLWDESEDELEIYNADILCTSTNESDSSDPRIDLYNDEINPGDDSLGTLRWHGNNDANPSEKTLFAGISALSPTITDGQENGEMRIKVMVNGTQNTIFMKAVGQAGGFTAIDIGNNTSSTTKVKGWFSANNKTPIAAPDYTSTTQEARNANTATTIGPLQDVVQTLIDDLQAIGLLR